MFRLFRKFWPKIYTLTSKTLNINTNLIQTTPTAHSVASLLSSKFFVCHNFHDHPESCLFFSWFFCKFRPKKTQLKLPKLKITIPTQFRQLLLLILKLLYCLLTFCALLFSWSPRFLHFFRPTFSQILTKKLNLDYPKHC